VRDFGLCGRCFGSGCFEESHAPFDQIRVPVAAVAAAAVQAQQAQQAPQYGYAGGGLEFQQPAVGLPAVAEQSKEGGPQPPKEDVGTWLPHGKHVHGVTGAGAVQSPSHWNWNVASVMVPLLARIVWLARKASL
jgi:hypothetical protein